MNSWANYEKSVDESPTRLLAGAVLNCLKISMTGAPTGGSVTVALACSSNPSQTASVIIPYNSTSSAVADLFVSANALFSLTNGTLFHAGGQALPAEIAIFFVGGQDGREWEVTSVTNSLTGGTSPAPVISISHRVLSTLQTSRSAYTIFTGAGSPASTGGSPTVTANNNGGPAVSGKYLQLTQNAGASMSATFTIPLVVDASESLVEIDIYNPHVTAVTVSLVASNSSAPSFPSYNLLPQQWTTLTTDLGRRTGTQTAVPNSAVNTITVRAGSVASEQSADLTNVTLYIGEIRLAQATPELEIIVDDCTTDAYTIWFPLAKQYPNLKFCFGLISDLIGDAGYISLSQAQEMNQAPNVFFVNHTFDHGNRASGTTQNYETGIDPLGTGEDTNEFVFGWKTGSWPGSGTFTLTFAGGTTAGIAYNAAFDALVPAIKAVVPAAIVTTEGWNSATLGGGMYVRVKLPAAEALPTISNTTNYVIGWAYSLAEVTRQYKDSSDYILENGLSKNGSHLVAITPLGSYGPTVFQALKDAGMTMAYQAGHVGNSQTSGIRDLKAAMYSLPRVDISSANLMAGVIGSALLYGRCATLMGHVATEGVTTTSPPAKNRAELQGILSGLNALAGSAFIARTPMERRTVAIQLFGPQQFRDIGVVA
mgnify:CR=1 FL=1